MKKKLNTDSLKNYAYQKRVTYWQIAEQMGVSEMTIYRKLRQSEISEADAETILVAIDAVCHERANKGIQEAEA